MYVCSKCGLSKPDTSEFYPQRDGHRRGGVCRSCENARKHTPERRARANARVAERRSSDEAYREVQRQRTADYWCRNREKYLAARKNPEFRKRQSERERQHRMDPSWRLRRNMGSRMNSALKRMKGHRSWKSLVGYSVDELMRHLESQFTEGMSWDNYGAWHVDHVRPCASFDITSTDDEAFRECWSLENLQPLWAIDNFRKNDRWVA